MRRGVIILKRQKSYFLVCLLIFLTWLGAEAQQNACGSQRVELILGGVIDIGFHEEGAKNVIFNFNSVNELVKGKYSEPQVLHVCSDNNFKVDVKMVINSAQKLNGNSIPPAEICFNHFGLKMVENNTTGNVLPPFSSVDYHSVPEKEQTIIANGINGFDQTFSLMYQFIPGFNMEPGSYSIIVIYTASME